MAKSRKPKLRFPRQPIEVTSLAGRTFFWLSEPAGYRIIRFTETECGVERYYVARSLGCAWLRLENHPGPCRKRSSAIAACQSHLENLFAVSH